MLGSHSVVMVRHSSVTDLTVEVLNMLSWQSINLLIKSLHPLFSVLIKVISSFIIFICRRHRFLWLFFAVRVYYHLMLRLCRLQSFFMTNLYHISDILEVDTIKQ